MAFRWYPVAGLLLAVILASCSSDPGKSGGGFYGGDSAPIGTRDFDSIPDAVPRAEPLSRTGNNPYTALGKRYVPLKSSEGFTQSGTASWYGTKFHGRRTSSGETYDMWAMTAAHPILPLPTYVQVTNLDTGKAIVVKVNDRGPFLHGRVIDLSYAAAHKLGIADQGTGRVRVVALDPDPGSYTATDNGEEQLFQPREGTVGASNPGVFLQTGAFSDPSNARSGRAKLRQLGYSVHPVNESDLLSAGSPYRVQAGPYQDYESAETARRKLEQQLGQQVILLVK
jgi:rare lipoprotein A